MATSVPAPMARPTSARASAGASLTPSPTMATRQAAALQLGDGLVLVLGEHLGEDLVDAEVAADGVGDLAGVTGDHHHPSTPIWRRSSTACAGLGADLVLERERADDLVVADEVEHGGAALLPLVDRRRRARRARRARARAAAPGHRPRSGRRRWSASTPRPVSDRKLGGRRRRRRARRRRRRSPGRAGARCRPRRPPARRSTSSSSSAPVPATPVTTWAPLVSVPVLSNSTVSIDAHPLEGEAVLDQDPGLGRRPPSTARSRAGSPGRGRAGRRSRAR